MANRLRTQQTSLQQERERKRMNNSVHFLGVPKSVGLLNAGGLRLEYIVWPARKSAETRAITTKNERVKHYTQLLCISSNNRVRWLPEREEKIWLGIHQTACTRIG
jgi:hypothetical protein